MSAINEWFGAYNMIFRHIRVNYGRQVLDDYLSYIGDRAYQDISKEFSDKGIEQIQDHYVNNFIKDGGTVNSTQENDGLAINVELCPAYKYMLGSDNYFDQPEADFCEACEKLNKRILYNSGYGLAVRRHDKPGSCFWVIKELERGGCNETDIDYLFTGSEDSGICGE